MWIVARLTVPPDLSVLLLFVGYPIVMLVAGFSSYPFNKKIAYGGGWNPGIGVLASVLCGMFSFLCLGLLGMVIMQTIAAPMIKKFGVAKVRKSAIDARIAELRGNYGKMPPGPM